MWWRDWSRIGTLLLAGIAAYGFLVVALRASGKRTLAKLNAFDFVVTIALGSVLATTVLSREVPVVEGVTALAVLVVLQFAVAFVAVRWPVARRAITSEPTALLLDGELRHDELRRCRVTTSEVAAAVRQAGLGSLSVVDAVVLETDGTISVIPDLGPGDALRDVSTGGRRPT